MYVLEVIPITRAPYGENALSYFSTKAYLAGDLVTVALRKKNIPAVVEKTTALSALKAKVKTLPFKLKPVKALLQREFLDETMLRALARTSQELFLPEGYLLSGLLPKAILSPGLTACARAPENAWHQKFIIRAELSERLSEYRSLIREHFARQKSLLLLTPRLEHLAYFEKELARGIEPYVFTFSSRLSSKKYLERWNQARRDRHPVLLIGTSKLLLFERPDLDSLILDDEAYPLWREEGEGIDFRKAAEIVAGETKRKLWFASTLPRIETIWRAERGEIEAKAPLTGRVQSRVLTELIELKAPSKNSFTWISEQARRELSENFSKGKSVLVFVNRKGAGSFTLCQDCGKALLCPACAVPLVLHLGSGRERSLLCHHCLKRREVLKRCPSCSSWRLKDYGLGIEKVALELKTLFGRAKFTIATEAVLSDPKADFELTFIPSLDHLFTIPEFRMRERIFRLLAELKAKTKHRLLLQTRFPERSFLEEALLGNFSKFWQEEIEERQALGYPPFKTLLKLGREDTDLRRLAGSAQEAQKVLAAYGPLSFPAFFEKVKNKYRWRLLLKLQPGTWPGDEKLSGILKKLKADWKIIVDPESIL